MGNLLGSLLDWHVIEVEVTGPSQADGRTFTTKTIRKNPADPGAVTGTATFGSFFSSLLNAARRHGYHPETGFILCWGSLKRKEENSMLNIYLLLQQHSALKSRT